MEELLPLIPLSSSFKLKKYDVNSKNYLTIFVNYWHKRVGLSRIFIKLIEGDLSLKVLGEHLLRTIGTSLEIADDLESG